MAKDKTPSDVSKMIKDGNVKLIDFKFTDLLGTWQHFTTTLTEYNEEIFTEGLGFDGSSIRGWRVINASDMLVIPDATTAWIDVFNAEPTLSLICTIVDPITREPYDRDPRGVAEKAEAYLKSTGIADTAFIGPEAEFFIFDDVRFANSGNAASYIVDSAEGHWNSAREEFPNLGYKIRPKEGYFPVSPMDTLQDIRNEMCLELEKAGVPIERQHHEVATAGQAEIDIRYAPLKRMGDNMQYYKYILRNVARRHNRTVTFMPKPIFGDNGSGMHTHISLWKDDKPLFAGNGYAGLSDTRAVFHWRNFETCAGVNVPDESNHQQLQTPRPRIRSAGQSRLLRPQSLGRNSNSDLLTKPESKAHRVPHAGCRCKSISRLLGDASCGA